MDTDVSAVTRSTTGASGAGPTRVRGVYWVATAVAGSVQIANGNGGTVLINITTPAAVSTGYILLPSDGVKYSVDPYITLTNATAATIFYG